MMSHKPKPVKDHYTESISVNSASLEKQLAEQSVQQDEIRRIMDAVSASYAQAVDRIAEECERDMMALERVPSPLKLFVDCIAEVKKSTALSPAATGLLARYVSAWEDWM